MANYKDLHGFQIKHRSSDPPAPLEGEIWYNTTTQKLKVAPELGAWASGTAVNVGRRSASGVYVGTTTSALFCGGLPNATPTKSDLTEEWDGSSWTESGDLNTGRDSMMVWGVQTAAVSAGGQLPPTAETKATEEYNGSSWSNGEDLPIYRAYGGGTGTLTAGLVCGGATSPDGSPGSSGATNVTNEYDGTDWTTGGTVNTSRYRPGVVGTQTAGLKFMGGNPGYTGPTETYDGSSWTTNPASVNAGRADLGAVGTQTSALGFGGYKAPSSTHTAEVEEWDGSTWSVQSTLSAARASHGSAGVNSSGAFCISGATPGWTASATTELWTKTATVRSVDTS
tara:strand:- start:972 stop:1988 length:1017 start_codon:yes stop_codon:yes gene_type:complete